MSVPGPSENDLQKSGKDVLAALKGVPSVRASQKSGSPRNSIVMPNPTVPTAGGGGEAPRERPSAQNKTTVRRNSDPLTQIQANLPLTLTLTLPYPSPHPHPRSVATAIP